MQQGVDGAPRFDAKSGIERAQTFEASQLIPEDGLAEWTTSNLDSDKHLAGGDGGGICREATLDVVFRFAGAGIIRSVHVLILRCIDRAVESLLEADDGDCDIGDEPVVQKQEAAQSCDLLGR